MTGSSETRSLLDDLRNFEKGCFVDLGHPLLNRVTHSFVKAAGIGAAQAVAREVYFTATEGDTIESSVTSESAGVPKKRYQFPGLKGETNRTSLESLVKKAGKESLQWGLAAGMYSGLTYGLSEARGAHDWKNSLVAGAVTGMAVALTTDDPSHEKILQSAITGAGLSAAANLLGGIF